MVNSSPPIFGPDDYDVASKAIVRAQFLLNQCGAKSDLASTRLAEIILMEMVYGCRDEDELVQAAVRQYLSVFD